jgi:hypothetical protein
MQPTQDSLATRSVKVPGVQLRQAVRPDWSLNNPTEQIEQAVVPVRLWARPSGHGRHCSLAFAAT